MKTLWFEDDCTIHDPLHESFEGAYRRLFGKDFDKTEALSRKDWGDCIVYQMPGGIECVLSYPGNSQINQSDN